MSLATSHESRESREPRGFQDTVTYQAIIRNMAPEQAGAVRGQGQAGAVLFTGLMMLGHSEQRVTVLV